MEMFGTCGYCSDVVWILWRYCGDIGKGGGILWGYCGDIRGNVVGIRA